MESNVSNSITTESKNADDFVSHLHEIIKNELSHLNSESVSSYTNTSINDLMMKLPEFLFGEKTDCLKVSF